MPFDLKNGKKKISLALKERVDIGETLEIWEKMKDKASHDVEVDMGKISFMDCSVLQLLLAVRSSLIKAGGSLRIVSKSDEAAKIIKLGGAAEVL